jgi:HAD superfamily hydrolase (TIGR01509 family)
LKKAVIFDMDGVLIDSEYAYFKRRMSFFDSIGEEPGTRSFTDFIGLSDKMIWEKLIPNDNEKRITLKEEYRKYREKNEISFKQVMNKSVKYVIERLRDKNIKVAIASSSERKEILRMMDECKLSSNIDFVISGEECTRSKPSPEIYNKAVEFLNISPEEALAVEDSTLGIDSAVSAGLEVAALSQKDYKLDQSKATHIIFDLKEIIDLIL